MKSSRTFRRKLAQRGFLQEALGALGLIALVPLHAALAQAPPAAPVVVSPITEQTVSSTQTLVGTVMPLRTSTVGSAVDGRLIEFLVNEGDAVKEGQPLAQVLTGTIEIDLARAKAEEDLRRSELEEMENGSRPEEIAMFSARMQSAHATLEYLAARHRRNEALYQRSQAITEDELERSKAALIEAQQAYADAKAAHALAVEGPRKEKIAQARAQLRIQEEAVHFIEDRIKKYTIRAPFDGYVITEGTEQGQWIKEAEVVAEVAELGQVEAKFYVPEEYISRVKLGMTVKMTVDSYPGQDFEGTVSRIVPQADVRSRTFPVKVLIQNTIEAGVPMLKSGMLARVQVAVGKQQSALIVPKDSLVLGGTQPVLQVVDYSQPGAKEGTVRAVPVQVGLAHGTWIQVTGEVKAGQDVVIKGNERLRPNQGVKVVQTVPPPK
jgi:RND family efflux transporter MFP subunit